jgi:hypothetical protein
VGRAINQRIAEPDVEAGEGRLLARGLRRSSRRIVSAPTTAQDVARRLSQISEADPQRPTLETLRNALSTFTAAQYGRNGTRDETALDEALDGASTAAAAVQARYRFPRSLLNRQRAPVTPAESQA